MKTVYINDSHCYPGCTLQLPFGFSKNCPLTMAVRAEFSDHSTAEAEIEVTEAQDVHLAVSSYTTRAGTLIPEKQWKIGHDSHLKAWKITGKYKL